MNMLIRLMLYISVSLSVNINAEPLPALEDLLDQQLKELPSNTQISTASRIERSSSDSMAITHVITDKEIRQLNLQSLADIISLFAGITIRDDSSFIYVGARGIGRPGDFNSRILFLLDGTRINENLFDAGLLGNENFVDVGLIERVEYSPGASAALYGNNALLGVINIVTKTSAKLRGVNTSLSLTNDNAKHARATFGFRSDSGADSWFSISRTKLDSIPYTVINTPEELFAWQDLNEEKSTRLMFSHQTGGFQLQAAASRRERNFPDGPSLSVQETPAIEKLKTDAYLLALSYDGRLSEDTELYFHASTHGDDLSRDIPVIFTNGHIETDNVKNSGRWSNLDGQLMFLGVDNHEVLIGVDYQRDHRQEFSATSSIQNGLNLTEKSSESRYGIYMQDLWRLTDNFKFQWALRYDNSDFSEARWSPTFTAKYHLTPKHSILARHSKAFRVTNVLERNANQSFNLSNPSNEAVSYNELSIINNWSSSLSSFATLYQADIDDLIHQDVFSPIYFNTPPIKSQGLEMGVDKRWPSGMSMAANMALQRTEIEGGNIIANSPRFIAQLRFSVPLSSEFLFSIHSHTVSKRKTFTGMLPKFTTHDASISWQNDDGMFIALGIRNLNDEEILNITGDGFVPHVQRRRQVHLSINWSWDND